MAKAALGDEAEEPEDVAGEEAADGEEDTPLPHMLIGNKPDLPIEEAYRGDKAGCIQVLRPESFACSYQ